MRILGALIVLACLGLVLAAGTARADTVTYGDFSDVSDFTLNGSTAGLNPGGVGAVDSNGRNVLRLTNDLGQAGSAFLTNSIALEDGGGFQASFSTAFSFRISDQQNSGADGIVFVVQTVANNVGGSGGSIGYGGITNSVGIEFDNWNNGAWDDYSESHIGINLNGNINSVVQANTNPHLDSRPANDWYAWIDYNGDTDLLEVRLNTVDLRPVLANLSFTVDLVSVLGQADAFIGFTSGTGAAGADHDIVDWTFRNTFAPVDAVPEPGTLALFGLGAATLALRRRKRPLA